MEPMSATSSLASRFTGSEFSTSYVTGKGGKCQAGSRKEIGARGSDGPIFDLQVRDAAEVGKVARKESGVVGEGDGGDFEVHGADTEAGLFEALEDDGGRFVEIENLDHAVDEQ